MGWVGLKEFADPENWSPDDREYWNNVSDFRKWARAPFWSDEQCVALTFAKDPDGIDSQDVEDTVCNSPFARHYVALHELILEAQRIKDLPERIRPVEFLAWARQRDITMPDELEEAVSTNELDIAKLEEECERLEERDRGLRRENQLLRYQLDRLRASSPPPAPLPPKELSAKERTSLYKLVIGMAIGGYKWDPKRVKNAATTEITDDLRNNNVALDQDTVLKFLRAAAEELPPAD